MVCLQFSLLFGAIFDGGEGGGEMNIVLYSLFNIIRLNKIKSTLWKSEQMYTYTHSMHAYIDNNIQIERNSCRNFGFAIDLCIICANHTMTG